MLTELKEHTFPSYPSRPIPSYQRMVTKYLRTLDFYDLPEEVAFDSTLYRDAHEPERLIFYKRDPRIIIYPSDIKAIYGKHISTACRLLQQIRDAKGLPKKAPITIRDFCAYTGLDYQTIHDFIMES